MFLFAISQAEGYSIKQWRWYFIFAFLLEVIFIDPQIILAAISAIMAVSH